MDNIIDFRKKKEFKAVDIFKLICAFLVVAIHVSVLGTSNTWFVNYGNYFIQQYFARISVPFFFICSGFFLFRKMPEEVDFKIIFKYVLHLLILYVIWSLIYLPLKIRDGMFSNDHSVIYNLVSYGYSFFMKGTYTQLWYFPALIFAVLIVGLCFKFKFKNKTMLIIGIILYLLGLLNQSYHGLIVPLEENLSLFQNFHNLFTKFIGTTRNGLFEGFLFVSLGAYLSNNPIKITKKQSWLFFGISFALLLVEVFLVSYFKLVKYHDLYLVLVPTSFFFFTSVASIEIGKESSMFKTCRSLSTIVFLVHLWVSAVVGYLFKLINIPSTIPLIHYLTTIIISLSGGLLVIYLQKYKFFKWLKYFY